MQRFLAAVIACVLVAGLFFAGSQLFRSEPKSEPEPASASAPSAQHEEIRAIWLSYPDLSAVYGTSLDRDAFLHKTEAILNNITTHGIDTVFLHVRPFSDALYRSSVFPWSAVLTGTQGVDPGYDPLQLFCETAERYRVQVHAWINPFRICSDETKWDAVSSDNPAKRFLSDADTANDTAVVHVAGGVYYDPASPAVRQLILDGVRELMQNYPVAGIHIDDYFYPAQDASVDEPEYHSYRQNGGKAPLDAWRRDTVSAWVRDMYAAVKSFGDDKVFSISPAADLQRNRDVLYAEVVRWCTESGYCDWIIPQLYVGFLHETMPFRQAAAQWNALPFADDVRLLYGLAAYKCGQTDDYAGSGAQEWQQYTDILSRQITFCRGFSQGSGFVFFSYSAFFGEKVSDNAKKELQSVTSVL